MKIWKWIKHIFTFKRNVQKELTVFKIRKSTLEDHIELLRSEETKLFKIINEKRSSIMLLNNEIIKLEIDHSRLRQAIEIDQGTWR